MIDAIQYAEWLRAENVQRCLLVEVKYHDTTEKTAYMASMPFASRPSDTPANQPYDDVVLDVPKFTAALNDAMDGFTIPAWGDILIDNSEFSRDAWLGYGWDGRDVSLLFGDPSWPRADFKQIMTGTVSGISAPASSQIKMSIKDRQWVLNTPIQTKLIGDPVLVSGNTYKVSESPVTAITTVWDTGTLVLPANYTTNPTATPATFTLTNPPLGRLTAEYTGGATATGQVVPLCYGDVFNITPVLLSASLLKYQVHDGAIKAISEIRDDGVPIAATVDTATGTFTLLSKPVGTVTCDVQGATVNGVLVEGTGRIMRHIILTRTDLTVADIDHDSLSAFLQLCPQLTGIYISARRNTLDVLDELIKSLGGFYTPSRDGKLFFGRVDVPAGTPTLDLTEDDIVFGSLKIVKQSVPQQTVRLAYSRNHTPQTKTAGAVTDANKALYGQQWQYSSRSNPATKAVHLLASEPDAKQTCIISQTDAAPEAERLLTLHGSVRTTYSAELISMPLTLNLGDVVSLTHPRYGLSAGKLLIVTAINESIINRRVTITLWG